MVLLFYIEVEHGLSVDLGVNSVPNVDIATEKWHWRDDNISGFYHHDFT